MIELWVIYDRAYLWLCWIDTFNAHPPQTAPNNLLAIDNRTELAQQENYSYFRNVPPFPQHEYTDHGFVRFPGLLALAEFLRFFAICFVAVFRDEQSLHFEITI